MEIIARLLIGVVLNVDVSFCIICYNNQVNVHQHPIFVHLGLLTYNCICYAVQNEPISSTGKHLHDVVCATNLALTRCLRFEHRFVLFD